MKKIILTFLSFLFVLSTANAQQGININKDYAAGNKMLMNIDSAAKNVIYANVFQNQPNTSFNFLQEVNNINIQIYFRKMDGPENYRYTILEDDQPIVVNKSINLAELKDVDRGDEDIFRSKSFGTLPLKNKVITIITYSIQNPKMFTKLFFMGSQFQEQRSNSFLSLLERKGVIVTAT